MLIISYAFHYYDKTPYINQFKGGMIWALMKASSDCSSCFTTTNNAMHIVFICKKLYHGYKLEIEH